jgi:adenosylhomocysteine nucleosidase
VTRAPATSLLVVAATPEEVGHLCECYPVLVTGIGKVPAAAAVAAALARTRYPADVAVVNVGTAGALRPGMNGIYCPSIVLNHDVSAGPLADMGFPVTTTLSLPSGDGSVLATGDVFVTEIETRKRLAVQAHLVDMEGFAVAWASQQSGAECRIVKHVSDDADESSVEWPSLVDHSARVLARWLHGTLEVCHRHPPG